MKRVVDIWKRRSGGLKGALAAAMFVGYAAAIGFAAIGRLRAGSGSGGMLLIYLPLWIAMMCGPGGRGPYRSQRVDPGPPQLRNALTPIFWSLVLAGMLLMWAHEILAPGFSLSHEVGVSWVANVFAVFMVAVGLGAVPDTAFRVSRHNAEQSQRLVAAESARAAARAQVLQSQMQPHFLFNALNTVTALLREDPARGRDVLLRLRALLERSLTTMERPFISLTQELAFVRDQLAIEQERFRDRLTVTFDVDPGLVTRAVPAFCIQPLVENALRHGIARSLDGGAIHVRASRDASGLRLEVQDTGAGLAPGWREGTGLSNLRQRLAAAYGSAATLTVTAEPSHTSAVATIPQDLRTSGPQDLRTSRTPSPSAPAPSTWSRTARS